MSEQECRFGYKCNRPDCRFSHPNNRAIDEKQSGGYGQDQQWAQPYYPNSNMTWSASNSAPFMPYAQGQNTGYYVQEPFMPDPYGAGPSFGGDGAYAADPYAYSGAPYGGSFTPDEDEASFTIDSEDVDSDVENDLEEMAIKRDTWIPTSAKCVCCEGYVYFCQGAACKDLGLCFCHAALLHDDQIDEPPSRTRSPAVSSITSSMRSMSMPSSNPNSAEAIKRDTWIPTSAKCTCCSGYVYNCQGAACVPGGLCFCHAALVNGGSTAAAATVTAPDPTPAEAKAAAATPIARPAAIAAVSPRPAVASPSQRPMAATLEATAPATQPASAANARPSYAAASGRPRPAATGAPSPRPKLPQPEAAASAPAPVAPAAASPPMQAGVTSGRPRRP